MGIPDSEIVIAIFQMLPGFILAWSFYGLTPHALPTPFEGVVQALIASSRTASDKSTASKEKRNLSDVQ